MIITTPLTNEMAPGCFMEIGVDDGHLSSNTQFESSLDMQADSMVASSSMEGANGAPACSSDLVVEDLKAQLAVLRRQLEQAQIEGQAKDRIIASLQHQHHTNVLKPAVAPAPLPSQPMKTLDSERFIKTHDGLSQSQHQTSENLNTELGNFLRNNAINNKMGISICQKNIDAQLQKLMQDRLATAQQINEDHEDHPDHVDDDSTSVSSSTTDFSSELTEGEISSSEASVTTFGNLQRRSLERIQHQRMTELAFAPPPVAAVETSAIGNEGHTNADASVDDIVGRIQRFLFLQGGNLRGLPALLEQYSSFCRAQCGIQHLDRLFFAGMMLPPQVSAFTWKWEDGKDMVHEEIPHLDESFTSLIEGRTLQFRFTAGSNQPVPPGSAWFREESYQDYLALPIYHQGEFAGAMTWATKSPDGFAEKEIQIFHESLAALSTVLRLHTNDLNMKVMQDRMMDDINAQTLDLAESNKRLVENNKRVMKQAQDQLKHFAMMSHEIRTPLNCIVGLSNLLLENPEHPLDAQVEESLSMITASGDLLLAVVEDVLDYSKLSTGNVDIEIAPVNIRKAVRTVVESIRIKAACVSKEGNKLELRTMISEHLPEWVDLDGRRLQQILYNLLGNAIKFGKLGKYVDFSINVVHSKDNLKDESDEQRSDPRITSYIKFSIKDYGTGIAEQDLKTIFQPFQQSSSNDAADGGTGLGLAITNQLCKVLGGDISVKSEKGKWSEFVVKLPMIKSLKEPMNDKSPLPLIEMERRELGRTMSQKLRTSFMNMSQSKLDLENSSPTLIPVSKEPRSDDDAGKFAPTIQVAKEGFSPVPSGNSDMHRLLPSVPHTLPTTAAPVPQQPHENDIFGTLRVLIAEDNLINQKVLTRTLYKLGMKNVDIVLNGLEAVKKSSDNEYDIIFMDWCMPVMNGLEATKQIVARREVQPEATHPRILFLTAHALEDYRIAAAEAGGDGFISKPFKLAAIKDFLEKQGLGGKNVAVSQSAVDT
jgi:signal transduction histidine kinase